MLLCSLTASADFPDEPVAVEPASFRIETITVETSRKASAGIIESETLLEEGGTYSEDDLRRAVARVHRLPFVLDATFSLRKGSERGAYELVIQANTARWFFFDRGIHIARFNQLYTLGEFGDDDTLSGSHSGLIGGRLFTGRSGVLYGSWGFQNDLASDASGAQIGYTQYNLLGRGIIADLSYARHGCCSTDVLPFGIDPRLSSWDWFDDEQASLKLAIPLAPHRSLQLGWTERSGQADDRRQVIEPVVGSVIDDVLGGEQDSRHLEARWVQDTSDDPILPSRGTVLSAGLEYDSYQVDNLRAQRYVRGPEGFFVPTGEVDLPGFDGEQLLATASAIRNWSVTPRQSVSAGGQISAGRSQLIGLILDDRLLPETDLDLYGVSIRARHLLRLWSIREPDNLADLYLDTAITYGIEATSPGLRLRANPLERFDLTTGLAFRTPWGRLRLALTFLDLGEVLR
ncbi:MAG: outer membrane protein insertion porin family [Acidobacteriota bacterium]|nr:outer membrane protein insertion porin family [Acidobacteriota bacterium]